MEWIDRYAGLVQSISRDVPVQVDGDYQIGTTETFPIACDVDQAQCWESGTYLDLVPNDRYKSVAYWEDLTGLQYAGQVVRFAGNRHLYGYEAKLRLVVWVNAKKMGLTGCDMMGPIIQDAIRVINGISKKDITSPIKVKRLNLTFDGTVVKDHRSIFGSYSYGQQSALFMYPWDFFAINVRCQMMLSDDCLSALGLGSPIEC
jgi:hypothetical protein